LNICFIRVFYRFNRNRALQTMVTGDRRFAEREKVCNGGGGDERNKQHSRTGAKED